MTNLDRLTDDPFLLFDHFKSPGLVDIAGASMINLGGNYYLARNDKTWNLLIDYNRFEEGAENLRKKRNLQCQKVISLSRNSPDRPGDVLIFTSNSHPNGAFPWKVPSGKGEFIIHGIKTPGDEFGHDSVAVPKASRKDWLASHLLPPHSLELSPEHVCLSGHLVNAITWREGGSN